MTAMVGLRQGAELFCEGMERATARRAATCRRSAGPDDQFDVRVRDEEFRIGRVDDQHPDGVVDRHLLRQAADLGRSTAHRAG